MKQKFIYSRGFTLLEISIALLLIGVLMASGLSITRTFQSADQRQAQTLQMVDIKQGMLTFLKVNKFLPCPDVDGDGVEDRKTKKGVAYCQSREGYLPSETLGLPKLDEWGNHYYYRVNARAEQQQYITDICESASVFGLSGARADIPKGAGICSTSSIFYCSKCTTQCGAICNLSDPRTADAPPYFGLGTPPKGVENPDGLKNMVVIDQNDKEISNAVVVMVVSYGSNGLPTWDSCINATANKTPERENCDGDQAGVFQIDTDVPIDDYLTWLTLHDVKQALIEVKGF